MVNRSHSASTSELSESTSELYDDSALEGVAANIKVLLKLIEDHKEACLKEKKDGRRMIRVAGMMTIIDMVKSRIQKCQSFGLKKPTAVLRRCNTDLRVRNIPKEKKESDQPVDEKECLKKKINASISARKSLEIMCTSLGKEKEIIANELSRKAHEANEMEDYINDLKAQNETLLEKVQEFTTPTAAAGGEGHKEKNSVIVDEAAKEQGIADLQKRNNELEDMLLMSVEQYRSARKKLQEAEEENVALRGVFEEMVAKVEASLERMHKIKQKVTSGTEPVDIKGEISNLEQLLECFDKMAMKYRQPKGECLQSKAEANTSKPSILA